MKKGFITIGIMVLSVIIAAIGVHFLNEKENTPHYWYVEKEFKDNWTRILHKGEAPQRFAEIRVWDGDEIPPDPGFLIATRPWQHQETASVYYRLSHDLEYNGAFVLAVDPWMIFRKHTDKALTANRLVSPADGKGALLISGQDKTSVQAWTARLIQKGPGLFPADESIWHEQENTLFSSGIFPNGAQTYTWQDVFYRLLGSEMTWVYAPLSVIRNYPNFRKSILDASPFPEPNTNQHSVQATLLWAVPLGTPKEQRQLEQTVTWLRNAEIQTLIADSLGWIPADPYGKPYDPVSLQSHRNWLTATYVYEVNLQ